MKLFKNVSDEEMRTIAVDFDGTLCVREKFPEIGSPRMDLINYLIGLRGNGKKVILWSCREGADLTAAVEWCRERGLEFDAINDNFSSQRLKGNPRKVVADLYIDDRSCIPYFEDEG